MASKSRLAGSRASARNEWAAALTRGPVEVLDFFLPLWAGTALGASAAEVGALTALETLVSFAVRPVAGALADRMDRGRLAAFGAVLYGLSFAGYAATPGLGPAFAAAVLGGVGGAVFWVSLRARVGEGLGADKAAFSRLFAAEGGGTWVAFVAALSLVPRIDYRGVFWLGAAACAVAAAVLLVPVSRAASSSATTGESAGVGGPGEPGGIAPSANIGGAAGDEGRAGGRAVPAMARGPQAGSRARLESGGPGFGQLGRRLRPMLLLVVITALAEAGVALLLLLHLQRGHHLELQQIAYVFLPGFIVYTTLPDYLHKVTRRLGRPVVLALAMGASAVFAAGLSFAPNPSVLAGLWVLSAAAFAAAVPVEQEIVAEAAGVSLGRAMGIYESATLLGATIGTFSAGLLYTAGNGWQAACLGAAAILLVGASLVWPVLRAVTPQGA